jgi:hypothetical protein
MNRNILLVSLIAVAGVAAGLAGTPAAAIDVECRYVIAPAPGEDPIPLPPPPPGPQPDQVSYVSGVTRSLSYRAAYVPQESSWSVVGVRSGADLDYNVALKDCDLGRRVISALPDVPVDFIAVDGNRPMPSRVSATVSNATDRVGTFALEYSTLGQDLAPGSSETLLMRGTPATVRDVYVASGTSVFISLRPLSGDADLFAMGSTSDGWMVPRAQASQSSTQPGLAEDRIVLTVPPLLPGRTFGVVVVNNASTTEAVLSRH